MHKHFYHHFLFFFLYLFLFTFHSIKSEIQTIKISSDSRPLILFQDFGFSNPGHISISISSISISTQSINFTVSSLMGCFYSPSPGANTMKLALLHSFCIIGKPFIFPIFTFNQRTLLSQSSINKTIPVNIPDLYYIFFLNCATNASISMNVNLETYNIRPNGDPDYVDKHFTNLSSTLFIFSFLFFVFLLTWLHGCFINKPFIQEIHRVMALLLFLRFSDLFCHAKCQYSVSLTGSPHGWDALWFAFYFFRNTLFVNVVVLIGAGWSLLRPCLQEFEKYVMSIATSLQVISSICFILMHGTGPSDKHYKHWIGTYYAVDFICCVTLLLPVLRSIDDNFGVNSKTEGKEAKRLAQLRVLENYALALYAYIGLSRLGMFVLRSITSYKFWCLTISLELAIELLFYIVVFLMFWPNERNDYAVLGNGEEELGSAHGL